MHQPIKNYLETYLRDSKDPGIPQDFHAHLQACNSCVEQLELVAGQSQLLRALREVGQEPRAGFYARVMNRIEECKPDSIWSVFLEPVLGRRLAYACAALVLLMGTYLVSTEPGDHGPAPMTVISQDRSTADVDGTVQPKDRDAVLVSLASFQE